MVNNIAFVCFFLSIFQLSEQELQEAVLLVFANKQDLPNAMSVSEIKQTLKLECLAKKVRLFVIIISNAHVKLENFLIKLQSLKTFKQYKQYT